MTVDERALVAPATPRPVAALDQYVRQCAKALWLWGRPYERARRRLTEDRGLPEAVLRANHVGFDLGPAGQDCPAGLPRVSNAVVLPVMVPDGAAYVQLRLLAPGLNGPRYLNPSSEMAPNPRIARLRPPTQRHDEVIVTEGMIDALSATAAGYQAVAVLGAGYPDPIAAAALGQMPHRLVIAFDPDAAGRAGADHLAQLLQARHRQPSVLHLTRGDLNESLLRSPDWQAELPNLVGQATRRQSTEVARTL